MPVVATDPDVAPQLAGDGNVALDANVPHLVVDHRSIRVRNLHRADVACMNASRRSRSLTSCLEREAIDVNLVRFQIAPGHCCVTPSGAMVAAPLASVMVPVG